MNLNERLEVAEESLALVKRYIVGIVTKKKSLHILAVPEKLLEEVQCKHFTADVSDMKNLMSFIGDSEEALEELKTLITLKDEQLKITIETNNILVNSLNAMKPENAEIAPA